LILYVTSILIIIFDICTDTSSLIFLHHILPKLLFDTFVSFEFWGNFPAHFFPFTHLIYSNIQSAAHWYFEDSNFVTIVFHLFAAVSCFTDAVPALV
jgi:hypothetical protein